ncbi:MULTISPECIES: hypothetical protein [unclassified Leptolyngbya]|uniref:hypothetical protein n=1 Tax=unclassified Leptolyngbya TaxID=2650499 RepID=UPI001683B4E7|nr:MULTISPECIES: hypothetical protein [unclassified Leptolyngbya]MBD1910108.1 hypothetical protein [Leptolyngbya sp. FACHB-8]MBD2156880.1 hypothetical protein [Leptolyngbya sp. FACHB-16]
MNNPPTDRLKGIELISCAKSVASRGLQEATRQCGYSQDTQAFFNELEQACNALGINISSINDLVTDQENLIRKGGVEVAPDSSTEL